MSDSDKTGIKGYMGQKYYYHLNGLKGLACILVMTGHYLGLYRYAESFVPSIHLLDIIEDSPFSFLISEEYWLYLFFVVSGYLVSKSSVKNLGELISKAVNRFLRLAVPILFSCFIIYLIYLIVGFHAAETGSLFLCEWYQGYYTGDFTIRDVLLSPFQVLFKGQFKFNAPYWVLHRMFISSMLIYVLKYLLSKEVISKYKSLVFSILAIVMIASVRFSPIITACLSGMLVSYYEESEIRSTSCFAIWFLFLMMSVYFMPDVLRATVFFAALIVFVPKAGALNAFFSSKPLQFLGKISWGIYSFHWPIICSVGALLIVGLSAHTSLTRAYALSCVFSVIITIVLSICFFYTFERLAAFLVKKANLFLSKILSKNR